VNPFVVLSLGHTLSARNHLKEGVWQLQEFPSQVPTIRYTDPRHYKVEFKNDRVRVVRIQYGPGEKSVMHSHPKSVTVFLTDAHAKFTCPDGRSEDIEANAGSVLHMDAFSHLPESLSSKPFEVIQIELK
jgi:quercetin dioxygenase-like cupin family protein